MQHGIAFSDIKNYMYGYGQNNYCMVANWHSFDAYCTHYNRSIEYKRALDIIIINYTKVV